MSDDKNRFKDSVNLPKTDFPIRAGLAQKEPELLAAWEAQNLYQQILDNGSEGPFVLHDGPPYPNGNIHMGHALNKILKDIVVRSRAMQGLKSPYRPGWDCHGLPIETQVLKSLKEKGQENKKHDVAWFRQECQRFALDYVDIQRNDFKKLGILGEWDTPYLTLNPDYEAGVIKAFGAIAKRGLIYQGLKPIHWCCHCETALAEAEIDYADHRSPSIYVRFSVEKPSEKLSQILGDKSASVLVWTTTPWTLPANVAVAAHPDCIYAVVKIASGIFVIADNLVDKLAQKLGWESVEILGRLTGTELNATQTTHPFLDQNSPIVTADYVSQDDGTGFVHIAPGHGQDDYFVGQKYGLETVMPVDSQGKFKTGEWAGQFVFTANKAIGDKMTEKGTLLHVEIITHSYPHCWRCKKPVIFRATKQWFIAMDKPLPDSQTLRQKALAAINSVEWYPEIGKNRITSMIENRPDWCISRQRFWGIPIPVFICKACDHPDMSESTNQAVQDLVKIHGSMAWFAKEPRDILPGHACQNCGSHDFKKETDILDVWFESGASFVSVLEGPEPKQAELYLEGSDQHRGWFQSSLLIGLAAQGKAPFKNVLTHGFLVDEHGKKMSKSVGNVTSPQAVTTQYGADVLRWWVAGSDFRQDVSLSENILKQSQDSFLKVRNTLRFLMSNLDDFSWEKDEVPYEKLNEIDQWALFKLRKLHGDVNSYYDSFEFHPIVHRIHDFCAVTLSSHYLDMTKDRLYCGKKDGQERRSTQTALYILLDELLKMLAPILVFTTEDAYHYFQKANRKPSVHLEKRTESFFEPGKNDSDYWFELKEKFDTLLALKDKVYQQCEALRSAKEIRSFLEIQVHLTLKKRIEFDDWETLFIVSQVTVEHGTEEKITIQKASGEKCERCWKILPIKNGLCQRCETAIKEK